MSNVIQIAFEGPRAEQIQMLQSIVSSCIRETVKELSLEQVQAFFDGYKPSIDFLQKAA